MNEDKYVVVYLENYDLSGSGGGMLLSGRMSKEEAEARAQSLRDISSSSGDYCVCLIKSQV